MNGIYLVISKVNVFLHLVFWLPNLENVIHILVCHSCRLKGILIITIDTVDIDFVFNLFLHDHSCPGILAELKHSFQVFQSRQIQPF